MTIDDNASDLNENEHNYGDTLLPLMYSSDDAFDDDNIQGTPSEYIPPKWTPFTNGFGHAVDYITLENTRHFILYQEAPLAPTAKLDSFPTIDPS